MKELECKRALFGEKTFDFGGYDGGDGIYSRYVIPNQLALRFCCALQHINPDGERITGPHLHWYRGGYGLEWAEAIDWYDNNKPLDTLYKFLDLIKTRFPRGVQEALL